MIAMLSSLEIKNFKGIREGSISDLAQANILVGRNNSGKSTILDALLLMRCAFANINHLGEDDLKNLIGRRVDRPAVQWQSPPVSEPEYRQLQELHYMFKTKLGVGWQ